MVGWEPRLLEAAVSDRRRSGELVNVVTECQKGFSPLESDLIEALDNPLAEFSLFQDPLTTLTKA